MKKGTIWSPAALLLAGLWVGACSALPSAGFANQQTDTLRQLVILYTNDEHGWMERYQDAGGAAGIARLWRQG